MSRNFVSWLGAQRIRLRKVALFLWLYTVVLSVPYALAIYGAGWLAERFGRLWWVLPAASLFLLASLAPIVYFLFVRRMETRILEDQRRYHRTLIGASSGMLRVRSLKRLCRLIVSVVNRTVRLTHTGLFLLDPKEKQYILQAVRHQSMMPPSLIVNPDDSLIKVIERQQDLLLLDELKTDGIDALSAREQKSAYEWMRRLEIRLIVPSFSRGRLLAFLALGRKRNSEPYTTDDIAIFAGLANQAALAIENALVFEELRQSEQNMMQSEKLASLGQLASGMAHEIHNPLTIISGEAQLYLARFEGKDPKTDKVLKSIVEECQRAADITRRILRFAKPAPVVTRLSELKPVDLRLALDDSLTLARYQVKLEKIKVIFEIPKDLPKVRGNENQLQEVILNLILNACQAMGEKGGSLTFTGGATNGRQVELSIVDTGPGVPASKLKKIFDPFFTTKQSGTGLGLFVCQRIIQSHGGLLEAASIEGHGTRFTIRLPAWGSTPATSGIK